LDTSIGEKAVASKEKGFGPLARKCRESGVDFMAGADLIGLNLYSESAGRRSRFPRSK
jgi:hypothetical protein